LCNTPSANLLEIGSGSLFQMVNMDLKSKSVKIDSTGPKRRRLRVGDPDFMPPDGGWGWLVVFACGFSNLSTFPMFQQFGLVFRQKFEQLNISNTQTTTVINMNSAFNSCVGRWVGHPSVRSDLVKTRLIVLSLQDSSTDHSLGNSRTGKSPWSVRSWWRPLFASPLFASPSGRT
jgi:hypothetical protein